jgi:hypothetical protein
VGFQALGLSTTKDMPSRAWLLSQRSGYGNGKELFADGAEAKHVAGHKEVWD